MELQLEAIIEDDPSLSTTVKLAEQTFWMADVAIKYESLDENRTLSLRNTCTDAVNVFVSENVLRV